MDCLIITGGIICESFALPYLEEHSFHCKIAVDRGLEFFYKINMKPDYLIGDFDSANALALEYFRSMSEVKFIELCPEKDDTDTEHAIHEAIKLGANSITILGATGKRIDHLLGTIRLLGIGLENNVPITIVDEYNRIRLFNNSFSLRKNEQYGNYVSLIPLSDSVSGVSIRGMKYPLEKATLTGFNALGVSNEIVDEEAFVDVNEGNLIVIESKD